MSSAGTLCPRLHFIVYLSCKSENSARPFCYGTGSENRLDGIQNFGRFVRYFPNRFRPVRHFFRIVNFECRPLVYPAVWHIWADCYDSISLLFLVQLQNRFRPVRWFSAHIQAARGRSLVVWPQLDDYLIDKRWKCCGIRALHRHSSLDNGFLRGIEVCPRSTRRILSAADRRNSRRTEKTQVEIQGDNRLNIPRFL
jgi:hypothetical protein